MIRRFTLFVVLALAALPSRGQELVLSSKGQGILDTRTNEQVLRDEARITDGTTLITADEVRYNRTTDVITATGHVIFTRLEVRLLADQLVLRRRERTFFAEHVRFGAHPYYAEAESASGEIAAGNAVKELTLTRATATYGEPGVWQPTLKADKIVYTPGQRLRTENAQAGIGHVQPLPFPRFQQSLKDPLVSFTSLNGGYRSTLGAYAEVGVHLPASPNLRLGGDLGIYTNRGIMFGPSGSYGGADDDIHGAFRSGYINDHGDKKTDILGRPVPENRGYVEWQHEQKLGEHLELTAQLNWWKDSEILRDFRPRAFFPVQQPDSFAEAVYAGPNYFVSLFARFAPNSFEQVQERLPELRFDLMPTAIGGGFVERFSASAAMLREDAPLQTVTGTYYPVIRVGSGLVAPSLSSSPVVYSYTLDLPAIRTTRLDAYYAIERPIAPTDWLSFTPVAGVRLTHYTDSKIFKYGPQNLIAGVPTYATPIPVSLPNYTRTLGEIGFDAMLRSSGTFDYKNARWEIDGLRHLFTPRLSYRYIPEADKGRGQFPAIDRQTFATYLQPLGLGDQRNIDDLTATKVLRLGFDNTLQTRDPVYGSRDLVTFNVANDFRFKRTTTQPTASEIHSELAFAPARWLSVNAYESFVPQTFTQREFNTGVTLHDGALWSVRFANNYLRQQIQDYQLDARVRINEAYEALTRLHYDARKHRFNEQAYGVSQNLGNTWLVSYIVSLYSGPRRESHFGLNVQIQARGF